MFLVTSANTNEATKASQWQQSSGSFCKYHFRIAGPHQDRHRRDALHQRQNEFPGTEESEVK